MAPANNAVLEVIELSKVFRDFWGRESVRAVNGLNFDVQPGEVFGLLGPNGSGKSTTVRMILGLLFPTQGAIRLFGRSPRNVDIKKRVGYMPEESHLYGYLNAEETLDFFGCLFKLPRAERRRRCDALIEMVGLRRARRRPIGQYSKGMARRIGLAQALINDPDFLILDEPTTGLDPLGTREMKDLILTLRDRGKTIFMCSHLLADVEEICDRICILYGGKRRALGPVSELLTDEGVTQINAPHLPAETVQKVVDLIRDDTGKDAPVKVSSPSRRLEEYFLDVVAEARREKLVTDGAESGTMAASFLGGEADGEDLLSELVAAGTADESTEEPVPETVAALPTLQDRVLIDDLVHQGTEDEAAGAGEEPEASVVPEAVVRKDVLEELMDSDEGADED